MLFQSFPFVFLLLPATLLLYWVGTGHRYRQWVLLIASYVFYGWWDSRFCALLLLSSLIDFVAGGRIAASGRAATRRAWLLASVTANLATLGFFKYWDFFADSANRLLSGIGLHASLPLLRIVLPLGISFYTFQSMSYTIDIYRGRAQATRSLVKFLAFVSLFPQLVAGPIVRWTELDRQLDSVPRRPDRRLAALGAAVLIAGLFKKLCIADLMFPMVDPELYAGMTAAHFWPAYLGWTFWIYYDFSSYSDMAVGLGLLFGLRLPINFHSPFKATSIAELWRRWHITLGRFMRDYVYFSIGGSRLGTARTLANILFVFLLIGLWHGATWTMVGWGAYMGVGLVLESLARRAGFRPRSTILRRALVLAFWANSGWLFRADSPHMTAGFLRAAVGGNGAGLPDWPTVAVVLGCLVHIYGCRNLWERRWRLDGWEAAVLAAMFVACVGRMFVERPFFYFQF